MTRINIEIPEELHKKAKIRCAMEGISLIQLINKAVENKVKKEAVAKRVSPDLFFASKKEGKIIEQI